MKTTPLVLVLVLAVGCATKIYEGPTSGRAAEAQVAISLAADSALEAFDAEPYRAQAVAVEVYGLTEKLEGYSPEEGYLRSLVVRKLVQAGARVVEGRADADILLAISLDAAGVDVIRRDLPLIYHHTTFRGLVRGRAVAYSLRERAVTGIIAATGFSRESIYREIYIFYVFGPITTREAVAPKLEPAPPAK